MAKLIQIEFINIPREEPQITKIALSQNNNSISSFSTVY